MKYASIFSGAGGVDAGASLAGLDYVWGIERNKLKWQVNRLNFPERCILADVRAVKPEKLAPVDVLWASPPCQHASDARRNGNLPEHRDRFIGNEVCRYLRELKPAWFFLENVPLYRHEPSFLKVLGALDDEYECQYRVLDFADYGVPMNRRRLILVANYTGDEIQFPPQRQMWTGWWDAVAPIWGNLERVDDFPKWQRECIARWVEKRDGEYGHEWHARMEGYVVNSQNSSKSPEMKLTVRTLNQPIFTLTCAHSARACYAYHWGFDGTCRLDQYAWARLMTLPDIFRLPRCYGQAIKCVGDMVPPSFVRQLLKANLGRLK
jgi:site-specific DNA-cytosine methylase